MSTVEAANYFLAKERLGISIPEINNKLVAFKLLKQTLENKKLLCRIV